MSNVILQGNSTTLTLNGYVFTDLIEGDAIELAPVNPKTFRINSAQGVTVGNRSDGDVHDLKIRVQKYGQDDVFLNSAMNQVDPVIFNGSMKENFIRDGADGVGSWILELGSLTDRPTDLKNTQDGNAVIEYTVQVRAATRNI
jgi:hypothetical protein